MVYSVKISKLKVAMQQRPQEEKRAGLIKMKTVGVEVVSSDEEDTLTQKMAKYWDPTPVNYSNRFIVDINRSPDDPLFYCSDVTRKVTWLPDPVTRGHVATLLRITREIALEDLKINKSEFSTNRHETDRSRGHVSLHINVEKSVLRQCCMELIPPGFYYVVHAVICYDSTDKIWIDNRIEDSGISKEKAADTIKRCTFPRNQAVALLYLAMHQPAAKATWVWYKSALAAVHKEMTPTRPKYIEMVVDDDPDAVSKGLEIRTMRQSSDEEPVVKKVDAKEPAGKYYDEALHLAHIVLSEPRVPPLIGALYGMFSIVLDFGYVYVLIQPTAQYTGKFRVGMGKHERCGEVITGDPQRVQEVLLDTTKLTIREMRLKYDQVYQRQCQKAKTEVVDELDGVEFA